MKTAPFQEGEIFSARPPRPRGGGASPLAGVALFLAEGLAERACDEGRTFERALLVLPEGCESVVSAFQALGVSLASSRSFSPADLPPGRYDLVAGLFPWHRCERLPEMLLQTRLLLAPGGVMTATFPGEETLKDFRLALSAAELRAGGGAGARVPPFVDVKTAGMLLQAAGFMNPVADVETCRVRYEHIFDLIRDLRVAGETSPLRVKSPLSRKAVFALADSAAAASEGGFIASFDFVTLTGRAPAANAAPAKSGACSSGKAG